MSKELTKQIINTLIDNDLCKITVTDKYIEEMAKSWCNSIDKSLPVYCGLEKGKVGERWKPITKIR